MNLTDHIEQCQRLADQLKKQGINPANVNIVGTTSASGTPYELGSTGLIRADGSDLTTEEMAEVSRGDYYACTNLGT